MPAFVDYAVFSYSNIVITLRCLLLELPNVSMFDGRVMFCLMLGSRSIPIFAATEVYQQWTGDTDSFQPAAGQQRQAQKSPQL